MLFLTYLPMKVAEDKRVAVAEYLTRRKLWPACRQL